MNDSARFLNYAPRQTQSLLAKPNTFFSPMDQRKQAPLQRHTAEASLDKREHAPLQRHTAEASWATSPPAQPQRIAVLAGHVTGLDLQEPRSPAIRLPRDLNANRVYCNCHSRLSHNAHTRNAAKSLLPILFIRVLADNFFLYRLSEARNVKYCPQLHARSGLRFIMRLQEDA